MAHSWHRGSRPLAVFCTACLAIAAPQAHALALGEPEVRSALGESLDIRIPVTIGKGESIEPSCFTLSRDSDPTVPRLAAARISIERSAQGTYLRIRTESSVNEPTLALGLIAACPGQFAEYHRDYSVLVDLRASTQAAPATPSPGSVPAASTSLPSTVATLIARIGDTLESIAHAIFPLNRPARKAYIEALREANPPLAALGDSDPIPVDAPIALPDLRTFARSRAPGETQTAAAPARAARAPPEPREPVAPRAPRVRLPRPAAEPRPAVRKETFVAKPVAPAPVRAQRTPGFVLKLSAGEIDLSPSRGVDERMRAQLRDRQLVLDADDQVAAVLALRNSVRQLESRVAELQLKLAGMPSSFPPPKVAEAPGPATPAPIAPPAAALPPVAPPAATPATVATPQPAPKAEPVAAPEAVARPEPVAKPEPVVKPEPVAPVVAAPPATTAEPVVAPPPAPPEETKSEPEPAPKPSPPPKAKMPPLPVEIDWLYYSLWVLAFLLVAAAALLAWRLARRRREETLYDEVAATEAVEDDRIVVADEPLTEEDLVFAPEAPAPPHEARRELDADVDIATRLSDGDTDDLRRRYIEERFPEIIKGAIVLDDPASVVKGARLFYEDGALARAVELLRFVIERNPEEVRTWLALFEIYRLERLPEEFAELARTFREHHGNGEYWRKVQYFGREIDLGNELYAETPLNTFETIGPSQAKRLAADKSFDPVTENWLGAPMDFENEVLANELRKTLMAGAGINEQDLVPNPMPALRNVEMFTVA